VLESNPLTVRGYFTRTRVDQQIHLGHTWLQGLANIEADVVKSLKNPDYRNSGLE